MILSLLAWSQGCSSSFSQPKLFLLSAVLPFWILWIVINIVTKTNLSRTKHFYFYSRIKSNNNIFFFFLITEGLLACLPTHSLVFSWRAYRQARIPVHFLTPGMLVVCFRSTTNSQNQSVLPCLLWESLFVCDSLYTLNRQTCKVDLVHGKWTAKSYKIRCKNSQILLCSCLSACNRFLTAWLLNDPSMCIK